MAMHYWMNQKHGKFISYSAAAILIFRAELSLFLGILLLYDITSKRLSIIK
jgi:alpha-1,6-mannosyltransferase